MSSARPFLGAWAIWLGGYLVLLAADLVARRVMGFEGGLSQLAILVTVVLVAGAASGFFLAAGARWSPRWRALLLLMQVPAAYMAAVTLGIGYLCLLGVRCP